MTATNRTMTVLTLVLVAMATLVLATAPAGAVELVNESFETPSILAGGVDKVQITSPMGPAGFMAMRGREYIWNEGLGNITTPFGDQVVGVFRGSTNGVISPTGYRIETTLITDVLEPATEYTLSFNAGNVNGANPAGGIVNTAELLAGLVPIDAVSVTTTTDDMSQSASLTFTTGLAHAQLGEVLGIRLAQTGGDWRPSALFDNVVLNKTGPSTVLSTGGTSDWNVATTWDTAIPTNIDLVRVQSGHQVNATGADLAKWLMVEDTGSKVTIDSGASVTGYDYLAQTGGAFDVVGSLTATNTVNVKSGSSMDVTGTLITPILNSAGTVTIGTAATTTGVAQTNLTDGSITGLGAMNLIAVTVDGGTLNAGGTVGTTALTYNTGTLNLAGNDLNAGVLTVNGALDVSGSTVTAATAINLNNTTLTIGHDIGTQTYTRDGGSIVGGVVTADTKYSLANIADYSDDIVGATAELVIGEAVTNGVVKLTGTGNTYGGSTTITSGVLEVAPEAANLGAGQLVFNGGVLRTSGTFARQLGAANSMDHSGNIGFAATDAPLTVTLTRADGTVDGDLQFSYHGNQENGASSITLGSTTSDAQVELTNGIFAGHGLPGAGGQSYHVKLHTVDNPNSNKDIALLSGDITNPADENQVGLSKDGAGTLWLTGTNSGFSTYTISGSGGDRSVLRAVDGVGLSPHAKLLFNVGVLESSGTFTREIGNTNGNHVDPGKVYWNNHGGFSAYGGTLTVSLAPAGGSPGDQLTWNSATLGFRSKYLYLGSNTADDVVTITNDIDGANGDRTIYVFDNPDVDTDRAVLAGNVTNLKDFKLYGDGTLELAAGKTFSLSGTETTADVSVYETSTLIVNGTLNLRDALTTSNSATLGGSGTINALSLTGHTTKIDIDGTETIAPGNSVGTLTFELGAGDELELDGNYEWEVGAGVTDIVAVTGAGKIDLNTVSLKILDAGGYDIAADDELTVFTYEAGVTNMTEAGLAGITFDTDALGGLWDWSAGLALTDDAAGTIYLTGLVRLIDVIDVTVPASTTLVQPLQAGQVFGTVDVGANANLTVDSTETAITVTNMTIGGGARVVSTEARDTINAVTFTVSGAGSTLVGGENISNLGDFDADTSYTNLVVGADAAIDWMFNASDETYIDVNGNLTIADGIDINISLADGSATPDGVDVKLFLAYDEFNVVDLATYTVTLPTGWDSDGLATLVEAHSGYGDDVTYLILQNLTSGGVVAPVDGDANGDTKVDEADMAILLAQFGSPYDLTLTADFTGDGFVDLEDFVLLRANWGEGTAPEATALPNTTPEPATMTMLALGGLAMLRRRRRKA